MGGAPWVVVLHYCAALHPVRGRLVAHVVINYRVLVSRVLAASLAKVTEWPAHADVGLRSPEGGNTWRAQEWPRLQSMECIA
jgi:hypothetical protein